MNFDVEHWDALVSDLYQSMLRPDLLASSVAVANTALQSDLCHIVGFTPEGKETVRIFTEKSLDSVADQYANYYSRIDPRRKFMQTTGVGDVYRCSTIYDEKFVSGNEFYQDFLLPGGFRYVIGSCLYRSDAQSIFVAFNHGKGRADFTDDEQRFFRLYIANLGNVIGGIVKLAPVSRALESEIALDALQQAVIGLNEKWKVSYTNAASERLIVAGLKGEIEKGQLCDGGRLAGVVRQVFQNGRPRSLTLPGLDGAAGQFVTVIRTGPSSDQLLVRGGDSEKSSSKVLLILSDGSGQSAPSPSQLIDMFRLSPAEARLAHQLTSGMSVGAFADRFCVSVATARTQLRAVLRKTGHSRQQELVKMLASLPRTGM